MRLYFPQSIEIPGTVQHISQQPNVRLHLLLFFFFFKFLPDALTCLIQRKTDVVRSEDPVLGFRLMYYTSRVYTPPAPV